MPTVSNGGKMYVFRLRKGLHYSDGTPIKASDFKLAVKRAIRMNWTGKSFLTGFIQGAEDFDSGQANDISGITTNDRTGKITVELDAPFGAIVDVLALPGTAPVPQGTPMKPQNSQGVIGDGPYKWGQISVGQSYQLVKNPRFDVPGLPRGHVDTIDYKVDSNVLANAQQVLQNQADVFDPGDTLPSSISVRSNRRRATGPLEGTLPVTFRRRRSSRSQDHTNHRARAMHSQPHYETVRLQATEPARGAGQTRRAAARGDRPRRSAFAARVRRAAG